MTPRPRWTAKQRAEIFRDAKGECHLCARKIAPGEKWDVEHPQARGLGGSDKQADMRPAHRDCHAGKTRRDRAIMAKADRQAKSYLGLKPKRQIMPGSRASRWKKRMDGTTVFRELEPDT